MTPASDCLIDLVLRLLGAGARHHAGTAVRLDLPSRDLVALWHLARLGETSPRRLGDALVVSSSGTTALIHRLSSAGLLQRAETPAADRRATLTLTDRGRALVDDLSQWVRDLVVAATADFDGGQLAAVDEFLGRLVEGAERRVEELVGEAATGVALAASVPHPPRWG